MSRELKKYTIKADNAVVMKLPHIIIMGHDPKENAVQLNIQGKISFEEMVDIINTAQYELLATFFNAAGKGLKNKKEEDKLRRDIYDRAVLGFSLMIDKFDPEAKNDKYAGFTNEAIMEAQNELLKKGILKKQKVKSS